MAKEISMPSASKQGIKTLLQGMPISFQTEQEDGSNREENQQKAALAKIIGKLSDEASAKAATCAEQMRILGDEHMHLVAVKERLYEEEGRKNAQMSYLEMEVAGQQTALNRLLDQIVKGQQEINVLCEKKRRAEEAEKKRRLIEQWMWVPGLDYNLYLAVDYLTDEDVQHLNSLNQDILRMQVDIDSKRTYLDDLAKKLESTISEQTDLGVRLVNLEQRIGKTISKLNEASNNLMQWRELQAYYNGLAAMLEDDNGDIEAIRKQLIDLPGRLEKIA
jgi:uncharacterized coiled-coil protein SlyX